MEERASGLAGLAPWLGAAGALGVLAAHVGVVFVDGHDAVVDPISSLSRSPHGHWHTLGLVGFAVAQVAAAVALAGIDRGRLWLLGRGLLMASGIGVLAVAGYFAFAEDAQLTGADANDPLSLVASLVGVAMAALQLGWARCSAAMAWFNGLCLTIWLGLVPTLLVLDASWLGAYERLVGATYVAWVFGISAFTAPARASRTPATR